MRLMQNCFIDRGANLPVQPTMTVQLDELCLPSSNVLVTHKQSLSSSEQMRKGFLDVVGLTLKV